MSDDEMFAELVQGLQTMPPKGKALSARLDRALELRRKLAADRDSLTHEEDVELLNIELGVLAAQSGQCTCYAGSGPHRSMCPLYAYR